MDYLLFEKGKVLPNEPTVQEAYSFFYPLDLYWGSFRLRQKLSSGFGSPETSLTNSSPSPTIEKPLSEVFGKVCKNQNHLGIGINSEYVKNDRGGAEEITKIKFFEVQGTPFQIPKNAYDIVYVLQNSTCNSIYAQNGGNSLVRYQYARYPDGRLVIYLFTDHESDHPVRIPSE